MPIDKINGSIPGLQLRWVLLSEPFPAPEPEPTAIETLQTELIDSLRREVEDLEEKLAQISIRREENL